MQCGGIISSCCPRNPHGKMANEVRERGKDILFLTRISLLKSTKSGEFFTVFKAKPKIMKKQMLNLVGPPLSEYLC